MSYRRGRLFYSFRTWTDRRGFNADREHEGFCLGHARRCGHLRLWDLNTNRRGRNVLRIVRGRGLPKVFVGRRYRRVL